MRDKKAGSHIIIAGQEFPIDCATITFRDEAQGFNAHAQACSRHARGKCGDSVLPYQPAAGLGKSPARLRDRRIKEKQTAAVMRSYIRQLVVHLDGCASAEMCFDVLHNERGLSCHFILDNDGTLYQTCDLAACAFHAAGLNETSIGIEICNRGDAKKDPGYYDQRPGPRRDVVTCEVNGHKYIAYDYTREQYLAMEALGKALAKHLPGIRLEYPQAGAGAQSWATMPADRLHSYSGYLGHYHITEQKWDPGPFDFRKLLGKVAGRRSFPIGLHGRPTALPDAPRAADGGAERAAHDAAFEAYYDNNELEGRGGYFPVGPVDRAQLWHGGVHLRPQPGQPVVASFAGKVVMVRNGPTTDADVGSTSFVLVAHTQKVGEVTLAFWSLYMHLAEERGPGDARPRFMASPSYRIDAEPGKVHALDPPEPVQAGDVIGHAGVGPGGEPTLHWEIFTLGHDAVEKIDGGRLWTYYRGGDSRFCKHPEVLRRLDVIAKDGVLTAEELLQAYRSDERQWARRAVTSHPSEWSWEPDWIAELAAQPGLRGTPRSSELARLVEQQIVPTLWWRAESNERAGLPADATVYTYHPVTFLKWLDELVGSQREETRRKLTRADYEAATGTGKLDIDDVEGTSFVSAADLKEPEPSPLNLEELLDGYGD